jgi:hypothetical protein
VGRGIAKISTNWIIQNEFACYPCLRWYRGLPFAVINADEYYGKNGFIKAVSFLGSSYGLVRYVLKNTLSDNGGVTRGICSVTDGILSGIKETKNIVKTATGAAVDGVTVDAESLVLSR